MIAIVTQAPLAAVHTPICPHCACCEIGYARWPKKRTCVSCENKFKMRELSRQSIVKSSHRAIPPKAGTGDASHVKSATGESNE